MCVCVCVCVCVRVCVCVCASKKRGCVDSPPCWYMDSIISECQLFDLACKTFEDTCR